MSRTNNLHDWSERSSRMAGFIVVYLNLAAVDSYCGADIGCGGGPQSL